MNVFALNIVQTKICLHLKRDLQSNFNDFLCFSSCFYSRVTWMVIDVCGIKRQLRNQVYRIKQVMKGIHLFSIDVLLQCILDHIL